MEYFKVKVKEEIEINNGALLKVEKNTYKIPRHIYCTECQNPPRELYSAKHNKFYLDDPCMTYAPYHKQYKCRSSICQHTLTVNEYIAMVRKGENNFKDDSANFVSKEFDY